MGRKCPGRLRILKIPVSRLCMALYMTSHSMPFFPCRRKLNYLPVHRSSIRPYRFLRLLAFVNTHKTPNPGSRDHWFLYGVALTSVQGWIAPIIFGGPVQRVGVSFLWRPGIGCNATPTTSVTCHMVEEDGPVSKMDVSAGLCYKVHLGVGREGPSHVSMELLCTHSVGVLSDYLISS